MKHLTDVTLAHDNLYFSYFYYKNVIFSILLPGNDFFESFEP